MRPRKAPAVPRKLNSIGPMDLRVSVVGTVKSVSDKKAVIEDDTACTTLLFRSKPSLRERELVRVFGKPNKGELIVELVQNMEGLDTRLYDRSMEVLL